jgi:hypothetical protein
LDDGTNWSRSILGRDLEAAGSDNTEGLRDSSHRHRSAFLHTHEFNDSVLLHNLSRQSGGGLSRAADGNDLPPIVRPAALGAPIDRNGEDGHLRQQRGRHVIPFQHELVDPRRSFHRLRDELLSRSGVLAAHHRHHVEFRDRESTARESIISATDRDDQTHLLRCRLDGSTYHDPCHQLSILSAWL